MVGRHKHVCLSPGRDALGVAGAPNSTGKPPAAPRRTRSALARAANCRQCANTTLCSARRASSFSAASLISPAGSPDPGSGTDPKPDLKPDLCAPPAILLRLGPPEGPSPGPPGRPWGPSLCIGPPPGEGPRGDGPGVAAPATAASASQLWGTPALRTRARSGCPGLGSEITPAAARGLPVSTSSEPVSEVAGEWSPLSGRTVSPAAQV